MKVRGYVAQEFRVFFDKKLGLTSRVTNPTHRPFALYTYSESQNSIVLTILQFFMEIPPDQPISNSDRSLTQQDHGNVRFYTPYYDCVAPYKPNKYFFNNFQGITILQFLGVLKPNQYLLKKESNE
jgi:hypothetical protein